MKKSKFNFSFLGLIMLLKIEIINSKEKRPGEIDDVF